MEKKNLDRIPAPKGGQTLRVENWLEGVWALLDGQRSTKVGPTSAYTEFFQPGLRIKGLRKSKGALTDSIRGKPGGPNDL